MLTTRPCFTPAVLYRVDLPVPLSETQNGDVAPNEIPQGLIRSGSVALVIRLVC